MITVRDSEFRIAAALMQPAFEEAKRWAGFLLESPKKYWLSGEVLDTTNLNDFFEDMGYGLILDPASGDVTGIYTWDDIDYGGEEFLFAAIAPFVTEGSWIEASIDDSFYRWEFNGSQVVEFIGDVCYFSHKVVEPLGYMRDQPDVLVIDA